MERLFFRRPASIYCAATSLFSSSSLGSHRAQGGERRSRRGTEAIEFALILPVFLTLVFGAFDYGLMFFTQFQASAVVHSALRQGALVAPSEYERAYGGCGECQVSTGERASDALWDLGIDVAANDLKPDLVQLAGACALVLRAEIPYTPLIGLFSVPDHYIVSSSLPAPMVPLCE